MKLVQKLGLVSILLDRDRSARRPAALLNTLALLLCMCTSAMAQTAVTGALVGTITDPTGAVVTGAEIKVTNDATGEVRTAESSADGHYVLNLLPPRLYTVQVTKAGFKRIDRSGVQITVAETATLNLGLEVGSTGESVTVTTEQQLVQTYTSALGRDVDSKAVTTLPLVTRNYTQILGLSPGVTMDVENAGDLGRGTSSSEGGTNGAKTVNGARPFDNNFEMDGVPINDNLAVGYGSVIGAADVSGGVPVPNPDTIQEFKVQTGQYDASFGRNAGANVNVVTKTGTNSFHGTVFEFLRNDDLNANEYFRKIANQPRGTLKQNQFGFTLGGPVIKDKLLFFGSYQGTRQRNGVGRGCEATLVGPPLTNDRSAAALGTIFGGQTGLFGGVPIAADGSNISPIALNFFQLKRPDGQYLIPTPQTVRNGQGFSVFSQACPFSENQYMGNVQFLQSTKSTLTFRYFQAKSDQVLTFGSSNVPGIPSPSNQTFRNISLNHLYIFGPRLINELIVGYSYINANQPDGSAFKWPDLGSQYPSEWGAFSEMEVFGSYAVLPQTASRSVQSTYNVVDSVAYSRGPHTLRFGGAVTRSLTSFSGFSLADGALGFLSVPDLLLGLPGCTPGTFPVTCNPFTPGATNGTPISNVIEDFGGVILYPRKLRKWDWNLFVQDDYKVGRRLTLNLGLRLDHLGAYSDALGRLSTFDFSKANPNPPPTGSLDGFIVSANYPGTSPAGVSKTNHDYAIDGDNQTGLAPRLGFAWQMLPNSASVVLRGGYGVYYSTPPGVATLTSTISPPWIVNLANSGAINPNISLLSPYGPGPFPMASQLPVFTAYSPTTLQSQVQYQNPSFRPGYAQEYNLNLQTDLGHNCLLELGYVGSRGLHLSRATLRNQALSASPSNPIRGVTTNTLANVTQRVPILGFAPAALIEDNTEGASWYNGVQTSLTKRYSRGLQFLASYTFSKTLDTDAVSIIEASQGTALSAIGDQSDPRRRYGRTNFDRPHRFVLSYTYDFPVSTSRSQFVGRLINGWQLSGVTTIQSGSALTVTGTNPTNVYGITADFAPLSGSCQGFVTPGSVQHKLNNYFDKSCFATGPTGAPVYPVVGDDGVATGFGNSGVGIANGPDQNNWDIALLKSTAIRRFGEGANLQFRAEFFNAFNTPQFSNPDTKLGDPTFGRITSTSVNPRIIQVALKLNF